MEETFQKTTASSSVPITTSATTNQPTAVKIIQSSAKSPQLHLQQQQPQQQQQQQTKPSFVVQKANLPPSSTITYQVGGQQRTVKAESVSFQINNTNSGNNNNGISAPQIVRLNPQPTTVRLATPIHQFPKVIQVQQQQQQQRSQPMLPVQPLPESSLQMIQVVPTSQQTQQHQQQLFQPRIVRLIQSPQGGQVFPRQATIVGHIHGANGTIPILQQNGILQNFAIPVSLLPATAQANKPVVTSSITFPQQPLPVMQAMQSTTKPVSVVSINNIAAAATTTMASTKGPTIVQIGKSPAKVATIELSNKIPKIDAFSATTTITTMTASSLPTKMTTSDVSSSPVLSSTFLPNDLSSPPEDIFDSEDAASESMSDSNDVRDFDFNIDDDLGIVDDESPMDNIVETSTVNVIVTSSSNNLMDFADFLDSDDEKMENNEADASDVSKIYSGDFQSGKEQLTQIPRGWLRRIVTSGSGATLQRNVCYISPAGQKFFSHATLEQHFARLGQSVMSGLFNFEPPQLVDEDEDDEEELEKCSTSSLQQHQQHQQQQQQQHLTSLST